MGVKGIDPRPPRIALQSFVSLAGDRDVGEYMREDAKLFLRHLEMSGCLSPLELCQYILAKGVRKHGSKALF